jgi:hypothetical protein
MNLASRLALTLAVGLGLVTPESRSSDKRAANSVVAPSDQKPVQPVTAADPGLVRRDAGPASETP